MVKTVESGGSYKQTVEISPKDTLRVVHTSLLLTCRTLSVLYRYEGRGLGLLNGAEDANMEKWEITPESQRLQFFEEAISGLGPFYEIHEEDELRQRGVLSPDDPRPYDQWRVQILAVVFGVKLVLDH